MGPSAGWQHAPGTTMTLGSERWWRRGRGEGEGRASGRTLARCHDGLHTRVVQVERRLELGLAARLPQMYRGGRAGAHLRHPARLSGETASRTLANPEPFGECLCLTGAGARSFQLHHSLVIVKRNPRDLIMSVVTHTHTLSPPLFQPHHHTATRHHVPQPFRRGRALRSDSEASVQSRWVRGTNASWVLAFSFF